MIVPLIFWWHISKLAHNFVHACTIADTYLLVFFLLSLLCLYGIISHALSSPIRSSHNHHFDYFPTAVHSAFCVSIHQPLGLLLSEGGCGIFNLFSDLSMCCAHKGKTNTDESAQV